LIFASVAFSTALPPLESFPSDFAPQLVTAISTAIDAAAFRFIASLRTSDERSRTRAVPLVDPARDDRYVPAVRARVIRSLVAGQELNIAQHARRQAAMKAV
jgi:hypothetical protein